MADLLNRAVGTKTRADFIQQLGPPMETRKVDGDEFFVYSETVNNPLADLGAGLSSGAAGYRARRTPRLLARNNFSSCASMIGRGC